MFDKSYVTVDPLRLVPLIETELQRLDRSFPIAMDRAIKHWEIKMRQRTFFGLVGPYWKKAESPTADDVQTYIDQSDGWYWRKTPATVIEYYNETKADFERLLTVARANIASRDPLYLKINDYHRFLDNRSDSFYKLGT